MTVGTTSGGAPGARILHTANCMEDKMIVYGGGTTQAFDSNVWVLDASAYPKRTWQLQNMNNTDHGPGPRMGKFGINQLVATLLKTTVFQVIHPSWIRAPANFTFMEVGASVRQAIQTCTCLIRQVGAGRE